ncbi:sugar phosphate nucleotidyltransferase [Colwelliaceae bacterium 6441]
MKQLIKTLVILAAGRGSRFGGAKQFHQFGVLNKTLMEYNICHAIYHGFTKIIFITQEAHQAQLTQQVITHLPKHVDCHIVYQQSDNLPKECFIDASRTKPLGTAHALWCARNKLNESFVVINADDYYGEHAFKLAAQHHEKETFAIVAYQLKQTLSKNGGVNRAICQVSTNKQLLMLTEFENIKRIDNGDVIGKATQTTAQKIDDNCLVSMNFWCLNKDVFPLLKQLLINTFSSEKDNNKECYLPSIVNITKDAPSQITRVLASHAPWFGVTYATDSANVTNQLTELTHKGFFHPLQK